MSVSRIGAWLAAAALLGAVAAPDAAAQRARGSGEASAFLALEHWAVDAVRRLGALGLVAPGGADAASRSLTRSGALALFESAVLRAERESRPAAAALAAAYRARLIEEFGELGRESDGPGSGARLGTAWVEAGYGQEEGGLRVGRGYAPSDDDWVAPTALEAAGDGWIGAAADVALGRRLVLVGSGEFGPETRWGEAYALVAWRPVRVWVGRRGYVYGAGRGGGLVLSGRAPYDGGGLFLADPITLPWVLRHLGPVRGEVALARLEENGDFVHPWLWSLRGTIAPHARLTIGLTRSVMLGGQGNTSFSLKNLAYVMIGKHAGEGGEFDNQIVSVDVRYRPPVPVPVVVYLEWGMEDSAGAWKDVPGWVVGAEFGALPGLPAVSAGLERTSFARSCCGNPAWYRNWAFRGGWADAGRPLGHPLGGHGTEWLAHVAVDLLDARLGVEGRVFLRERREENLFIPDRLGESRGGEFRARLRASPRFDVEVAGRVDSGDGWRESGLSSGVRVRF